MDTSRHHGCPPYCVGAAASMLGQPRGGYGTIIIAWRASMRRAPLSLLPSCNFFFGTKSLYKATLLNASASPVPKQAEPMWFKSSPAGEQRVISHR